MPLSGTTTHCVVDIIRRHFPRRRHVSLLRQLERYRDTQPEVSPMGIKTHITYANCVNAFSLSVLAKNQICLKLFIACTSLHNTARGIKTAEYKLLTK